MERPALAVIFFCMPCTAALVLAAIWTNAGHTWPLWLIKIIPTGFVIGLASFLTWFTLVMKRTARHLEKDLLGWRLSARKLRE